MAKRPELGSFKSALDEAEARPFDAPAPARPASADTSGLRKRTKAAAPAKSAVFVRVNPEALEALQDLAREHDTFMQDLGVLALNDLLVKFGKEPIVRTPSTRD